MNYFYSQGKVLKSMQDHNSPASNPFAPISPSAKLKVGGAPQRKQPLPRESTPPLLVSPTVKGISAVARQRGALGMKTNAQPNIIKINRGYRKAKEKLAKCRETAAMQEAEARKYDAPAFRVSPQPRQLTADRSLLPPPPTVLSTAPSSPISLAGGPRHRIPRSHSMEASSMDQGRTNTSEDVPALLPSGVVGASPHQTSNKKNATSLAMPTPSRKPAAKGVLETELYFFAREEGVTQKSPVLLTAKKRCWPEGENKEEEAVPMTAAEERRGVEVDATVHASPPEMHLLSSSSELVPVTGSGREERDGIPRANPASHAVSSSSTATHHYLLASPPHSSHHRELAKNSVPTSSGEVISSSTDEWLSSPILLQASPSQPASPSLHEEWKEEQDEATTETPLVAARVAQGSTAIPMGVPPLVSSGRWLQDIVALTGGQGKEGMSSERSVHLSYPAPPPLASLPVGTSSYEVHQNINSSRVRTPLWRDALRRSRHSPPLSYIPLPPCETSWVDTREKRKSGDVGNGSGSEAARGRKSPAGRDPPFFYAHASTPLPGSALPGSAARDEQKRTMRVGRRIEGDSEEEGRGGLDENGGAVEEEVFTCIVRSEEDRPIFPSAVKEHYTAPPLHGDTEKGGRTEGGSMNGPPFSSSLHFHTRSSLLGGSPGLDGGERCSSFFPDKRERRVSPPVRPPGSSSGLDRSRSMVSMTSFSRPSAPPLASQPTFTCTPASPFTSFVVYRPHGHRSLESLEIEYLLHRHPSIPFSFLEYHHKDGQMMGDGGAPGLQGMLINSSKNSSHRSLVMSMNSKNSLEEREEQSGRSIFSSLHPTSLREAKGGGSPLPPTQRRSEGGVCCVYDHATRSSLLYIPPFYKVTFINPSKTSPSTGRGDDPDTSKRDLRERSASFSSFARVSPPLPTPLFPSSHYVCVLQCCWFQDYPVLKEQKNGADNASNPSPFTPLRAQRQSPTDSRDDSGVRPVLHAQQQEINTIHYALSPPSSATSAAKTSPQGTASFPPFPPSSVISPPPSPPLIVEITILRRRTNTAPLHLYRIQFASLIREAPPYFCMAKRDAPHSAGGGRLHDLGKRSTHGVSVAPQPSKRDGGGEAGKEEPSSSTARPPTPARVLRLPLPSQWVPLAMPYSRATSSRNASFFEVAATSSLSGEEETEKKEQKGKPVPPSPPSSHWVTWSIDLRALLWLYWGVQWESAPHHVYQIRISTSHRHALPDVARREEDEDEPTNEDNEQGSHARDGKETLGDDSFCFPYATFSPMDRSNRSSRLASYLGIGGRAFLVRRIVLMSSIPPPHAPLPSPSTEMQDASWTTEPKVERKAAAMLLPLHIPFCFPTEPQFLYSPGALPPSLARRLGGGAPPLTEQRSTELPSPSQMRMMMPPPTTEVGVPMTVPRSIASEMASQDVSQQVSIPFSSSLLRAEEHGEDTKERGHEAPRMPYGRDHGREEETKPHSGVATTMSFVERSEGDQRGVVLIASEASPSFVTHVKSSSPLCFSTSQEMGPRNVSSSSSLPSEMASMNTLTPRDLRTVDKMALREAEAMIMEEEQEDKEEEEKEEEENEEEENEEEKEEEDEDNDPSFFPPPGTGGATGGAYGWNGALSSPSWNASPYSRNGSGSGDRGTKGGYSSAFPSSMSTHTMSTPPMPVTNRAADPKPKGHPTTGTPRDGTPLASSLSSLKDLPQRLASRLQAIAAAQDSPSASSSPVVQENISNVEEVPSSPMTADEMGKKRQRTSSHSITLEALLPKRMKSARETPFRDPDMSTTTETPPPKRRILFVGKRPKPPPKRGKATAVMEEVTPTCPMTSTCSTNASPPPLAHRTGAVEIQEPMTPTPPNEEVDKKEEEEGGAFFYIDTGDEEEEETGDATSPALTAAPSPHTALSSPPLSAKVSEEDTPSSFTMHTGGPRSRKMLLFASSSTAATRLPAVFSSSPTQLPSPSSSAAVWSSISSLMCSSSSDGGGRDGGAVTRHYDFDEIRSDAGDASLSVSCSLGLHASPLGLLRKVKYCTSGRGGPSFLPTRHSKKTRQQHKTAPQQHPSTLEAIPKEEEDKRSTMDRDPRMTTTQAPVSPTFVMESKVTSPARHRRSSTPTGKYEVQASDPTMRKKNGTPTTTAVKATDEEDHPPRGRATPLNREVDQPSQKGTPQRRSSGKAAARWTSNDVLHDSGVAVPSFTPLTTAFHGIPAKEVQAVIAACRTASREREERGVEVDRWNERRIPAGNKPIHEGEERRGSGRPRKAGGGGVAARSTTPSRLPRQQRFADQREQIQVEKEKILRKQQHGESSSPFIPTTAGVKVRRSSLPSSFALQTSQDVPLVSVASGGRSSIPLPSRGRKKTLPPSTTTNRKGTLKTNTSFSETRVEDKRSRHEGSYHTGSSPSSSSLPAHHPTTRMPSPTRIVQPTWKATQEQEGELSRVAAAPEKKVKMKMDDTAGMLALLRTKLRPVLPLSLKEGSSTASGARENITGVTEEKGTPLAREHQTTHHLHSSEGASSAVIPQYNEKGTRAAPGTVDSLSPPAMMTTTTTTGGAVCATSSTFSIHLLQKRLSALEKLEAKLSTSARFIDRRHTAGSPGRGRGEPTPEKEVHQEEERTTRTEGREATTRMQIREERNGSGRHSLPSHRDPLASPEESSFSMHSTRGTYSDVKQESTVVDRSDKLAAAGSLRAIVADLKAAPKGMERKEKWKEELKTASPASHEDNHRDASHQRSDTKAKKRQHKNGSSSPHQTTSSKIRDTTTRELIDLLQARVQSIHQILRHSSSRSTSTTSPLTSLSSLPRSDTTRDDALEQHRETKVPYTQKHETPYKGRWEEIDLRRGSIREKRDGANRTPRGSYASSETMTSLEGACLPTARPFPFVGPRTSKREENNWRKRRDAQEKGREMPGTDLEADEGDGAPLPVVSVSSSFPTEEHHGYTVHYMTPASPSEKEVVSTHPTLSMSSALPSSISVSVSSISVSSSLSPLLERPQVPFVSSSVGAVAGGPVRKEGQRGVRNGGEKHDVGPQEEREAYDPPPAHRAPPLSFSSTPVRRRTAPPPSHLPPPVVHEAAPEDMTLWRTGTEIISLSGTTENEEKEKRNGKERGGWIMTTAELECITLSSSSLSSITPVSPATYSPPSSMLNPIQDMLKNEPSLAEDQGQSLPSRPTMALSSSLPLSHSDHERRRTSTSREKHRGEGGCHRFPNAPQTSTSRVTPPPPSTVETKAPSGPTTDILELWCASESLLEVSHSSDGSHYHHLHHTSPPLTSHKEKPIKKKRGEEDESDSVVQDTEEALDKAEERRKQRKRQEPFRIPKRGRLYRSPPPSPVSHASPPPPTTTTTTEKPMPLLPAVESSAASPFSQRLHQLFHDDASLAHQPISVFTGPSSVTTTITTPMKHTILGPPTPDSTSAATCSVAPSPDPSTSSRANHPHAPDLVQAFARVLLPGVSAARTASSPPQGVPRSAAKERQPLEFLSSSSAVPSSLHPLSRPSTGTGRPSKGVRWEDSSRAMVTEDHHHETDPMERPSTRGHAGRSMSTGSSSFRRPRQRHLHFHDNQCSWTFHSESTLFRLLPRDSASYEVRHVPSGLQEAQEAAPVRQCFSERSEEGSDTFSPLIPVDRPLKLFACPSMDASFPNTSSSRMREGSDMEERELRRQERPGRGKEKELPPRGHHAHVPTYDVHQQEEEEVVIVCVVDTTASVDTPVVHHNGTSHSTTTHPSSWTAEEERRTSAMAEDDAGEGTRNVFTEEGQPSGTSPESKREDNTGRRRRRRRRKKNKPEEEVEEHHQSVTEEIMMESITSTATHEEQERQRKDHQRISPEPHQHKPGYSTRSATSSSPVIALANTTEEEKPHHPIITPPSSPPPTAPLLSPLTPFYAPPLALSIPTGKEREEPPAPQSEKMASPLEVERWKVPQNVGATFIEEKWDVAQQGGVPREAMEPVQHASSTLPMSESEDERNGHRWDAVVPSREEEPPAGGGRVAPISSSRRLARFERPDLAVLIPCAPSFFFSSSSLALKPLLLPVGTAPLSDDTPQDEATPVGMERVAERRPEYPPPSPPRHRLPSSTSSPISMTLPTTTGTHPSIVTGTPMVRRKKRTSAPKETAASEVEATGPKHYLHPREQEGNVVPMGPSLPPATVSSSSSPITPPWRSALASPPEVSVSPGTPPRTPMLSTPRMVSSRTPQSFRAIPLHHIPSSILDRVRYTDGYSSSTSSTPYTTTSKTSSEPLTETQGRTTTTTSSSGTPTYEVHHGKHRGPIGHHHHTQHARKHKGRATHESPLVFLGISHEPLGRRKPHPRSHLVKEDSLSSTPSASHPHDDGYRDPWKAGTSEREKPSSRWGKGAIEEQEWEMRRPSAAQNFIPAAAVTVGSS